MCQTIDIFIECFCSNRVNENYFLTNCSCQSIRLGEVHFNACEICFNINNSNQISRKLTNIFKSFKQNLDIRLYYLDDVYTCVERNYFRAR